MNWMLNVLLQLPVVTVEILYPKCLRCCASAVGFKSMQPQLGHAAGLLSYL